MERKADLFVCVAPAKEVFDVNGKSLGTQGPRALYNRLGLSRTRIYRDSKDTPQKGMNLIKYRNQSKAQQLCDEINKVCNDEFVVEKLEQL